MPRLLTGVLGLIFTAIFTVACATTEPPAGGPRTEMPIDDVRKLAADWRSLGNVTRASIHISEDGSYQGIAASGARTTGRITVTGGKASYRSTTSEGTVTLSQEGGKDVLTFVPSSGGNPQKLERLK